MLKIQVVILSALILSACNAANTISYEMVGSISNQGATVSTINEVKSVAIDTAFVRLPKTDINIIAVNEQYFKNGVQQRIILANPSASKGQNYIEVNVNAKSNTDYLKNNLLLHSNSAYALKAKFAKEFPGTNFTIASVPTYNRYGLYGLSYTSTKNNIGCILSWQKLSRRTTVAKGKSLWGVVKQSHQLKESAELSYQLRYCGLGLTKAGGHQLMQEIDIIATPEEFKNVRSVEWQSEILSTSHLTYSEALSAIEKRKAGSVVASSQAVKTNVKRKKSTQTQVVKTEASTSKSTKNQGYAQVPMPQ